MNEVLLVADALGRPRGMVWGGRREEGSGWGTHVYLWRIHFDIWSVFIPIPKKGNAKEYSNYHTIGLISHVSKVMFKILQARLQQYVNYELSDVQAGFRKGRRTRDQIANICWIIEKARRVPEKHLFLLY